MKGVKSPSSAASPRVSRDPDGRGASRSLLIGTAIAAVLIAGAAGALAYTRLTAPSAHDFKIVFPTADGLVGGSDVLVAGAKIGTVGDIQPMQSGCPAGETHCAQVTVNIEDAHWPLHAGLRADIRPKSLLGEKYVDLHDGAQGPTYDTNRVLVADKTAVPVELDQLVNSLDPPTRSAIRVLLDDLGAGVAGQGMNLNQAIATGRANLANLAVTGQTLNNRDADLDRILVGLDKALSAITTNGQLTQWSQLISNGQGFLNDIESVQARFSRSFTDANIALGDLNNALGGAVPSLRTTLNVAPSLVSNLQQEADMLTALASTVTTSANRSPGGECTGATVANQPITSVTGVAQCSPLWMITKGLLSGPSASSGALALPTNRPMFRICVEGVSPQTFTGSCDNSSAGQGSLVGLQDREGAMLTAMLGT